MCKPTWCFFLLLLTLVWPISPAQATTLMIGDVYLGTNTDDKINFITLRFAPKGGGNVKDSTLWVFNGRGEVIYSIQLDKNVNNIQDGAPILLATQEAAQALAIKPDFLLDEKFSAWRSRGAICVRAETQSGESDDCFTYGSNSNFNPSGGLPPGFMAQRYRSNPSSGKDSKGDKLYQSRINFRLTSRFFVINNAGELGKLPSPPNIALSDKCGNGNLDADEQCDDNNLINQDDCSMFCQMELPALQLNSVCGNHILEGNERCDPPGINCSSSCNSLLQLSVCGDGTIGAALNFSDRLEYCDTNDKNLPQEIGICTRGCTFTADRKISTCGNRILEPGEECDDGNLNDLDGCSKTCLVELTTQASPLFKNTAAQQCGNGILEPYEQCDLGDKNGSADALCNSTCQIPSTNPNNATANPNDSNTQNPGPPPENTTQNPATTVSLLNRGLRQLHCQTAHTPQVFYYVLTVYLCQYRILNRLVRRKKNEP